MPLLHLGCSGGKSFSRWAAEAAWRRLDTPSFAMMWETCTLTVLSLMKSRRAICWLESPRSGSAGRPVPAGSAAPGAGSTAGRAAGGATSAVASACSSSEGTPACRANVRNEPRVARTRGVVPSAAPPKARGSPGCVPGRRTAPRPGATVRTPRDTDSRAAAIPRRPPSRGRLNAPARHGRPRPHTTAGRRAQGPRLALRCVPGRGKQVRRLARRRLTHQPIGPGGHQVGVRAQCEAAHADDHPPSC